MLESIVSQLQELPCYFSEGREHIYNKHLISLAKKIGKDQKLAEVLWKQSNVLGAKHLAIQISEPENMSFDDLNHWLKDINDWGTCDSFCAKIVRETPFAINAVFYWCSREPEFERRAGFSTIAQMAWKKSDVTNDVFISFLTLIEKYAYDDRYFVKKAVNWALRDIGKRNQTLKEPVLKLARELQQSKNKTKKWVGTHRIKEIISKQH